jgi:hypothetical protein
VGKWCYARELNVETSSSESRSYCVAVDEALVLDVVKVEGSKASSGVKFKGQSRAANHDARLNLSP